MPMNSYEFSPQRHYKPCDSPLDYARVHHQHHLDSQQMLTSDVVSSSTAAGPGLDEADSIEVSPDPLQCPICNFSTQSR
jgi:hypothetical protein